VFHEESLNLNGFVHVTQDNIQYEKIPNKHETIETGRVHQVTSSLAKGYDPLLSSLPLAD